MRGGGTCHKGGGGLVMIGSSICICLLLLGDKINKLEFGRTGMQQYCVQILLAGLKLNRLTKFMVNA
jgi:hypothetical protein